MNDLVSQYDVIQSSSAPQLNLPQANSGSSLDDDDWFYESINGGWSARGESGAIVNPITALSHGPVWQAVNTLAGDTGQLPFRKMVRRGRDRHTDEGHPLDFLFRSQPNQLQTPSVWKETMLCWALLWGNGISYISRGGGFRVDELIPLLPDRTGYDYRSGLIWTWINEEYFLLEQQEVFHIRGLALDGNWGRSAVEVARDVVGHGLALRKHGNYTFRNGAMPGGVLMHPGKLSPEARNNLRNEWNSVHGGLSNRAKIAILMEGANFAPMSVTNTDAQWLEALKLDREQVASLFCLPAHKLNALENAAVRANLEQQNLSYLQMSLSRWLNRFAEEAERKLLTERERRSGRHWFRWFTEAFLRGDTQTRYEAYEKAISSRWMNPNEVREREDMNPYDGGDEFSNPNIDPSAKPEDNEKAEQAMWGMMATQVTLMLEHEAKRINKAAAEESNFIEWLDSYLSDYAAMASRYLAQTARVIEALGSVCMWQRATEIHAEKARQNILAATEVPKSQLVHKVGIECRLIAGETNEFLKAMRCEDAA